MPEFLLGVAASLVASALLVLAVYGRTTLWEFGRTIRLQFDVTRRLRRGGIKRVFLDRSDYIKTATHGTIAQYLGRTPQQSLVYVGLWLSHGIEMANVQVALRSLLDRGVSVELVFMSPTTGFLRELARALAVSETTIEERIGDAIAKMGHFQSSLPPDVRGRFSLKTHSELTTASAFVMDVGAKTATTLVDFKLFGQSREKSFGMELRGNGHAEMYTRVTQAFQLIQNSAIPV